MLVGAVQAQSVSDTSLAPGLVVKVWHLEREMPNKLERLKLSPAPNQIRTSPDLAFSPYLLSSYFLPEETFVMHVDGYFLAPDSGLYQMNFRCNQIAQLFVDDKLLAEQLDPNKSVRDNRFSVRLSKGLHKLFAIQLNQNPSQYQDLTLWWTNPTTNIFERIPPSQFLSKKKVQKQSIGSTMVPKPKANLKNLRAGRHPALDVFDIHSDNFQPKTGGIDFLPDGRMVVCTWDSTGSVYLVEGFQSKDSTQVKVKRIAWGLNEPLGLKVVDGAIYVLQKPELTKLVDLNGDDIIDQYQTICNAWGTTGNFHEFAFGLVFKDGYFYATLATSINPGGKSTRVQHPHRGKAVKIGMDGSFEMVAKGLRTPNGIGLGVDNEIFIADNQGDWLPACKVVHLEKGAFYGSYSVELYDIFKWEEKPPVVWLPQNEIGNSTSEPGIMKFGPWKGQLMFGDVTHGGIKRAFVERVDGQYQGVAFNFTQGLAGGINRICWGPDGALYAGAVGNPGNWSQSLKQWFGLQRIEYNKNPVFELLAVRAKRNGLELEFTEPLADTNGNKLDDYVAMQWQYIPTQRYGGPKENLEDLYPKSLNFSADRKRLFLELDSLRAGRVVYIKCPKSLKSSTGNTIWTYEGWYTLNIVPQEAGAVKVKPVVAVKTKPGAKPTATIAKPVARPKPQLTEAQMIAQGQALIEPSGCLQCHRNNEKLLGPSFADIAGKYANTPANLAKLNKKVYEGGTGVWGNYAMAAQSHLQKPDIDKMVRWILSLRK